MNPASYPHSHRPYDYARYNRARPEEGGGNDGLWTARGNSEYRISTTCPQPLDNPLGPGQGTFLTS